jgi:hypothetical protein
MRETTAKNDNGVSIRNGQTNIAAAVGWGGWFGRLSHA